MLLLCLCIHHASLLYAALLVNHMQCCNGSAGMAACIVTILMAHQCICAACWHGAARQLTQSRCLLILMFCGCPACVQDVVALIAYEHPEQSPLAHLLQLSQREVVADAVNAAILQASASGSSADGAAAVSSKPQVRRLCGCLECSCSICSRTHLPSVP